MNEHLYCQRIFYSFEKDALCFPICAMYASLFCSSVSSETGYLYVKRNPEIGELELKSSYENWSANFPPAERIFHEYYDLIDEIYSHYEELVKTISDIESTIKLGSRLWFHTKLRIDGISFSLSSDRYAVRNVIRFSESTHWTPTFIGMSHGAVLVAKENMEECFSVFRVDVSKLERLFIKPEKKKKESFWNKLFRARGKL